MDRATLLEFRLGSGSILNIVPATPFESLVPRETFNKRLHADFQRVGDDVRRAFEELKSESADESQARHHTT